MTLDFDEMKKAAEIHARERDEANKRAWAEFDRQQKERADAINTTLSAMVPRQESENEAAMMREIEGAKDQAEADIREKYRKQHGNTSWNSSKTTDALRNMIRSMSK